jgi:hypothetical protein
MKLPCRPPGMTLCIMFGVGQQRPSPRRSLAESARSVSLAAFVANRYGSPMHYLDAHAGSLQVISSVVLAVITIIYTILTRTMAKAATEGLRPYVYLDVFFTSPAEMILLVGNSGTRVAGSISVKLAETSSVKLGELIEELPLASGIGHLAPGGTRRYRLIVGSADMYPHGGPSPALRFELLYHDGPRSILDTQQIDLAGFEQSLFPWTADATHEIVNELKEIARKLHEPRRSIGFSKLCQYCGTRLPESATKCHGCLEWLPGPAAGPWKSRSGAYLTASVRSRRQPRRVRPRPRQLSGPPSGDARRTLVPILPPLPHPMGSRMA